MTEAALIGTSSLTQKAALCILICHSEIEMAQRNKFKRRLFLNLILFTLRFHKSRSNAQGT